MHELAIELYVELKKHHDVQKVVDLIKSNKNCNCSEP